MQSNAEILQISNCRNLAFSWSKPAVIETKETQQSIKISDKAPVKTAAGMERDACITSLRMQTTPSYTCSQLMTLEMKKNYRTN